MQKNKETCHWLKEEVEEATDEGILLYHVVESNTEMNEEDTMIHSKSHQMTKVQRLLLQLIQLQT